MTSRQGQMADLLEAEQTLFRFLAALARSDGGELLALSFDPEYELRAVPVTERASTVLDLLGVDHGELVDFRVVHTARVIAAGRDSPPRVAFGIVSDPATAGLVDGPTLARLALAFVRTEDGWKFWGPPTPREFGAAVLVRLPATSDLSTLQLSKLGN